MSEQNSISLKFGVAGLSTVLSSIGQLSGKLGGLHAVAIGLVSGGLGAIIKNSIGAADGMGLLAQRTGIGVEAISGLTEVSRLADASSEELQTGLKHLSLEMAKAGRGGESLELELLKISDQFKQLPDGIQRTAFAQDKFGKSSQSLIPFLSQGSAAIKAQMDEARNFGQVVGPGFARNADTFNDNLDRIKGMFRGLALQLSEALLPELIILTEWTLDFVQKTGVHKAALETLIDLYKGFSKAVASLNVAFSTQAVFWSTFAGSLSATGNPITAFNDALEAVNKNLDEYAVKLKRIDNIGKEVAETTEENSASEFISKEMLEARRKELDLEIQIQKSLIDGIKLKEAHAILNDYEIRSLRKHHAEIEKLIELKRELANFGITGIKEIDGKKQFKQPPVLTPAEGQTMLLDDDSKSFGNTREKDAIRNPNSFNEQLGGAWNDLQMQAGTTAEMVARSFTSTIGSAVEGIAGSIKGLLNLTMSWGEALRNIGTSIVGGIIDSFSRMVSEWIMSHIIMKGVLAAFSLFGIGLKKTETAAAIASESSKTPGLTLNAGMASITSYGAAAAIGLAAVLGVIASLSASSYEVGGYTGHGGRTEPAGIVHRGEFVMPADATARIGIGNLEAMAAGQEPGQPVAAPAQSERLSIAVVDNRQQALAALDGYEGRRKIIQIINEERHNLGI